MSSKCHPLNAQHKFNRQQQLEIAKRQAKIYNALKFNNKRELPVDFVHVSYKSAQCYLKYELKKRIINAQKSGNYICRITGLQFMVKCFKTGMVYLNIDWIQKMVEYNLVKVKV